MNITAITDIGNVRPVNQDYVRYIQKSDNEALIVLCDGMGGHNAGEIASQMTCDDILAQYELNPPLDSEEDIRRWISQAINHANTLVKNRSYESPLLEGMGTTIVLTLIKNGLIYISHVGDSRAYVYEGEELVQLTRDDSMVNVLVDSGILSPEEAMFHPQKNILVQAVGVTDILKISFLKQPITCDSLLVCTDGLYNSLFDMQIEEILKLDLSTQEKGQKLLTEAKKYGGKDNIGFALLEMKGDRQDGTNS